MAEWICSEFTQAKERLNDYDSKVPDEMEAAFSEESRGSGEASAG